MGEPQSAHIAVPADHKRCCNRGGACWCGYTGALASLTTACVGVQVLLEHRDVGGGERSGCRNVQHLQRPSYARRLAARADSVKGMLWGWQKPDEWTCTACIGALVPHGPQKK